MEETLERIEKEINTKADGDSRKEGKVAKFLENQTAKIPSDAYLWAAFGSMGVSLTLKLAGREKDALFVGQWAPSFLIIGVYNKMVKLLGNDLKTT